jgi:hypothetical protein
MSSGTPPVHWSNENSLRTWPPSLQMRIVSSGVNSCRMVLATPAATSSLSCATLTLRVRCSAEPLPCALEQGNSSANSGQCKRSLSVFGLMAPFDELEVQMAIQLCMMACLQCVVERRGRGIPTCSRAFIAFPHTAMAAPSWLSSPRCSSTKYGIPTLFRAAARQRPVRATHGFVVPVIL